MAPLDEGDMHLSMDDVHENALAGLEESELLSGATATLSFTFTAASADGALEFACHLSGHYEAGMKLAFAVES